MNTKLNFETLSAKTKKNAFKHATKFTLFPIYSEDQILSNYSQSGSPEKVNGLQIPKYPFLIKNPENCTYYWY